MERASHKRGLFAGEPCAHEGSYVLARPVDWAFNLSRHPAMLNDVGFWRYGCSKALADAAGRVTICFHRNAMTAQETPVCLSVFVAADCHDHPQNC